MLLHMSGCSMFHFQFLIFDIVVFILVLFDEFILTEDTSVRWKKLHQEVRISKHGEFVSNLHTDPVF